MNQPPQWTPLPQGMEQPMPYYGGQLPQAPPSKPSGVYKALGIVMICLGAAGAFWALFSIASLVFVSTYAKMGSSLYGSETLIFGVVRSVMSFVTGTMLAIAGFGIFRAKKWSRYLALGYAALSLFDTFAGTAVNVLVIQPKTFAKLGPPVHEMELFSYATAAFGLIVAAILPIVVIVMMVRAPAKQELDA